MPDGMYERDILVWSEQQAALLRRLAAGERMNDAVDWPNLIEEVETMGRAELRSCTSLLRQALLHLAKLHQWPGSTAAPHWRGEVLAFLGDAQDAFTSSMRHRIDVPDLYADALARLRVAADDSGPAIPLPATCPFSLDDLLQKRPDVDALVARL